MDEPDPITEKVAEKIANEMPAPPNDPELQGTHLFIPTPGWAVRMPAEQDPKKRNGYEVQSEWMSALGIYATAHGSAGLMFYGVLVVQGNKTQKMIRHTPDMEWVPAQIKTLPSVRDSQPVTEGA